MRRTRLTFGVFLLGGLAASSLVPIQADEGRIPVFMPGTFLAAPGRYFLTDNLTGTGFVPVITIGAPDIELDLNGFVVDEPSLAAPAISITAPPGSKVLIRNGTILSGSAGIENAAPFGQNVVVEEVTVRLTGGPGIHLTDVESARVRNCLVLMPMGPGILLDTAAPFLPPIKQGAVENNVIRVDGFAGIMVTDCSSMVIRGNQIEDPTPGAPGAPGIALGGCEGTLVYENTVQDVGGVGIQVGDFDGSFNDSGNKIYNNVIRSAGSHGIAISMESASNLVLNNLATNCGVGPPLGGHGLFIEGDNNLVDRNVLNSNSGGGLVFGPPSSGNTFGRNTARANTGVALPVCGAAPALFPPNSCNGAVGPPVPNSTYGDNLIPGPPIF